MLTRSDNKTRAAALLDHAKQLRNKGNVNQAVDVCRQALKLNPSDISIHRHLALNLKTCKRYAEAIGAAKAALVLDPDDPTLMHILDSLEHRPSSRAPIGYVNHLFDHFASTFDQRMNVDLEYRVPRILGKRLKRITRQRGQFKRALDLGCGTGLTGATLRPYTRYLVGVDISQKMLCRAYAKSIYNALHCDDIGDYLNREQMCFDLIVAADVFIYFGELTQIFRLVRKRMRKKGLFAFSTEKTNRAPYRLRKSGRFAHHPDYISKLANQNGFTIKSVSTTGIRMENNQWVSGGILMLEKSSSDDATQKHSHPLQERLYTLVKSILRPTLFSRLKNRHDLKHLDAKIRLRHSYAFIPFS